MENSTVVQEQALHQRDMTRKTFGPRPGTVTITDWHGQNPRTWDGAFGGSLPDEARAYYNAQRAEANAACAPSFREDQ